MVPSFYFINLGPNHPSAHGVLRLLLSLFHELVLSVYTVLGLLHRSTEKLIEYRSLLHALPYCDRLDYVSCICQEDAVCSVLLKLCSLSVAVSFPSSLVHQSLFELYRILNHLLAVSCLIADLGLLSSVL